MKLLKYKVRLMFLIDQTTSFPVDNFDKMPDAPGTTDNTGGMDDAVGVADDDISEVGDAGGKTNDSVVVDDAVGAADNLADATDNSYS